jgi:hypothetical protein
MATLTDPIFMFQFLNTKSAISSGEQLAKIVVNLLPVQGDISEPAYLKKHTSTLRKLSQQIDWLKLQNKYNFYQKAKLGNTFRWMLIDAGYDDKFTKNLTQWVLVRFNKL